jgi:PAS domain S-box-containing protein
MAGALEPRKKKSAPGSPDTAAELRRQAEEQLAGLAAASPFPGDPDAVAHELLVHQIELEMQNEELRRAQLELQASHDKYFARFELAPVGYFTLSKAGVVEEANLTAGGLLGVERQELVGRPFHDFVVADDQDVFYRQHKQLAEYGRSVDFELRLKHAGGAPVWASLQGKPMDATEDEPLRIHLTFADVTQRGRSEAALAESERLFRLMFEQAPIGVALVGLDFRFLRVNPRFAQITGYSEEELLERGFPDLTHPDDVAGDVAASKRLTAGESGEYAREKRYLRKDGSIAWVDIVVRPVLGWGGEAITHLMMARDITERRQAEEALRESGERLRTVFEAAREGIVLQGRNGRIHAWNTAAEDVFGVAESEIVGETVLGRDWRTVHEDGTPWPPEEFPSLTTLATGKPQHDVVMGVLRDDELRWINISAVPVFGADETGPTSAVITFADITARIRTERLLAAPSEVLAVIAAPLPLTETVAGIVAALKEATGFDAVGLRLQEGEDYPFVASVGYSDEFLEAESSLAVRYPDGGLCRNADGSVSLECTCGLVLSGKTDSANPLYTANGSAWTNDSPAILDVPPEEDPRLHPRNLCVHLGFLSFALVPLRAGEQILGLLHLADHRKGRFTAESISFFEGLGASIGAALAQKRLQEALNESEEKFKYVFEHSVVGKSLTLPSGRVNVNEAFCRILGYTPGELAQRTWQELTHPDDVAETESQMDALRSGGAASVHYVKRFLKKDGSVVWADISSALRRDGSGEPLYFMTTALDITASKQTERLLSVPSEILAIIAADKPVLETVEGVVAALKQATDFDAVGLRLQEGEDFPFIGAQGYSDEFLETENTLAARYPDGGLCRNPDGSVSLECTCGLVVSGQADPANPLFSAGGSAWTNDSLPFLDVAPEDDPRLNPRNRCIHVGFRSIALIPLRAGEKILGLLHLGDRRTDRFTAESIGFFEGLGASIGAALAQKRVQEALRESQERLREAHRLAHIGAWNWHAASDTVTWTEELFRIAGRDPQLATLRFAEHATVFAAESWGRLQAAVAKSLESGAPYELYLEIVRPDGTSRWVEAFGGAVLDDQGRVEGLRGTMQDITERREAEDEIRRLHADLADRFISRTDQMEAATRELEALAYSVTHDVRTPLRTIDGFSAILIEDERERLSPEGVDGLLRVRAAAQTLARLLDELTGLSNVSRREVRRQKVDLSALAEDVGAELAAGDPSREVELSVAAGLSADADPALLRLILLELMKNAWKFTRRRDTAHVEVGALDADGERAFFVRDDGAGFDMRRAEHLFGVFQRLHTSEEFEGDGVGLATVQRLVRRHGGEVWAQAEVEKGATFSFTLPAAQAAG